MKTLSLNKAILIIIAVLLVDQLLKIYIKLNFTLGDGIEVFEWFKLSFVENEGMAFGMQIPGDYGKVLLTSFRLIAIGAIAWWLYDSVKKNHHQILIIAIALIFAGAAGNIIDSLVYGILFSDSYHSVATFMPEAGGYSSFMHGKVVDMFYFPFYQGTLPEWVPIWGGEDVHIFKHVFNVADAAITVGVAFLIIFNKKAFAQPEVE